MNKQIDEFMRIVDSVHDDVLSEDHLTSSLTEENGTTITSLDREQLVSSLDTGYRTNNVIENLGRPEQVVDARSASAIEPTTTAAATGTDLAASYRSTTLLDTTTPFVVANDGLGASGSRAFAEPLNAIASIGNDAGRFCAGTLVAPNVIVSARHCNISGSDRVTFGADLDSPDLTVGVESVILPGGPEGSQEFLDGNDVAIVILDSDVPSSVAEPIQLVSQTTSLIGEVATIAGFGLNGIGSEGNNETSDGFRWGGQNVIDFYGELGGGENLFFADFDDGSDFNNTLDAAEFGSNAIPLELEALISEGDSGSPLLVQFGDQLAVAGVATGGLDIFGQYGSFAFWTGVGRFQSTIESFGASFADSNGGSEPGDDDNGGTDGGGNSDLPASDDHSNSILVKSTGLEFSDIGERVIARDTGDIGFVNNVEDQDVFRFETTSRGRVIVDARARSAGFDSFVSVFDADGNMIAQNDNSENPNAANANDSQVILRNIDAGEYFVVVSGADNSTGQFRVGVRSTANVASADNSDGNTFSDGTRVVLNPFAPTTFVNSSIDTAIDNDFYSFTARENGRLVVRSNSLSGNLNTVLRGFDADRNILDANNNFGGSLDSRISFNIEEGESYAFRVSSVGLSQGDYRLSLRVVGGDGGSGTTPFTRLTLDESHTSTGSNMAVAESLENQLIGQDSVSNALFAVG